MVSTRSTNHLGLINMPRKPEKTVKLQTPTPRQLLANIIGNQLPGLLMPWQDRQSLATDVVRALRKKQYREALLNFICDCLNSDPSNNTEFWSIVRNKADHLTIDCFPAGPQKGDD